MELTESIAELVGMNTEWVEGLAKANRNSIIALRNCCVKMAEDNAHQAEIIKWHEQKLAELEASINK